MTDHGQPQVFRQALVRHVMLARVDRTNEFGRSSFSMSCAISQIDSIVSTGLSNIASSCSSCVQIKDADTLARGEKCRSGEVLRLFRHQSGVAHVQSGRQEPRKSVLHRHGTTWRPSKQIIAPTSKLQKSFLGNKSHGKSLARCASCWAKWLAALTNGTERYLTEYNFKPLTSLVHDLENIVVHSYFLQSRGASLYS